MLRIFPSSDPVAPNIPGIVNSGLDVANTFYWDKKAMAEAPGDYTKAKITHWLYSADGTISGIASSEKAALENRVWYTYAGQPDPYHVGPSANPSQVARVLGDGSTQLSQFEYNSIGQDDEGDRSGGPGDQFHLRHKQRRSARNPADHGREQRSRCASSPTTRSTSRSPTRTPRDR